MRIGAAVTVVALILAVPMVAGCTGTTTTASRDLPPPVNYRPAGGLSPDLSIPVLITPDEPPFNPDG